MRIFKRLIPIFVICISIILVGTLAACGGDKNNDNKNGVQEIVLSDGTNEGSQLNYTYVYGEDLDFVGSLKLYLKNSDGTKVELTEEQFDDVQLSYYLQDGTTSDVLSSNLKLDAGSYNITITYKNYTAYIGLTITQAPTEDTDDYRFIVTNVNGGLATNIRYGTGNIEDNNYTSSYLISIRSPAGVKMDKRSIDRICYLTESEYTEFKALTTQQSKDEYLENHEIIRVDEDVSISRDVVYNFDGTTDSDFYFYDSAIPGTYYMFAHLGAYGNYQACFLEPNNSSRITIIKAEYNLADLLIDASGTMTVAQMISTLNLHAEYTYGTRCYNDANFNPQEEQIFGDITLGNIFDWNYTIDGIPYNSPKLDENPDMDRIQMSLLNVVGNIRGFGQFEFLNPNDTVNSNVGNNGVITKQAKFVLNEYYANFCNVNGTFPVTVTIHKGEVDMPYIYTSNIPTAYEYSYGGEHNLQYIPDYEHSTNNGGLLSGFDTRFLKLTNDSDALIQTNIGTYHTKIELIDPDNYVYKTSNANTEDKYYGSDDLNSAVKDFTWSITKRTIQHLDYTISYNNQIVYDTQGQYDSTPEITYERGVKNVTITFYSEFEARYLTEDNVDRNFTWKYSTQSESLWIDFTDCVPSTGTDMYYFEGTSNYTHTFILEKIPDSISPIRLNIDIAAAESVYFNAYDSTESYNTVYLILKPSPLTEEELTTLLTGLSVTKQNDGSYTRNSLVTIQNDYGDYKISQSILPTTNIDLGGLWTVSLRISDDSYENVSDYYTLSFDSNTHICIIDWDNFPDNIADKTDALENHSQTSLRIMFKPSDDCVSIIVILADIDVVSYK